MNDKLIGRNPVREAIKSGRDIDKILVKKGEIEGSLVLIIKMAKNQGIPVVETDKQKLDQIAEGENHQGVIAYVATHSYCDVKDILASAREKGHDPFIIILDKITSRFYSFTNRVSSD